MGNSDVKSSESLCLEGSSSNSFGCSLPSIAPKNASLSDANARKRYAIVETEATEPFKRRRWMCMDKLGDGRFQQTCQTISGVADNNNNVQCLNTDPQKKVVQLLNVTNQKSFLDVGVAALPSNVFSGSKNNNVTKVEIHSIPSGTATLVSKSNSTDESVSRTSKMVIDEKIDKLIELGKLFCVSHVRDQLNALKGQVEKLTVHLELENKILKANATEETLAHLSININEGEFFERKKRSTILWKKLVIVT